MDKQTSELIKKMGHLVMTLALGSWPKQMHGKVWVGSAIWQSHTHFQKCGRVWKSEPMHCQIIATLILGS
jgi:hypothetical protein